VRAAIRRKYGGPEVLTVEEVERPTPRAGQVLIRVHAATVNRSDLHVLRGRPLVMRLFTGLVGPRCPSTGTDFAGEVEAVGPGGSAFQVGQRVMGFRGPFGMGSHAQYVVCTGKEAIVDLPGRLGYAEAAACIEGATYAAGSVMHLRPVPGQTALVNGATGAIGSAYVQFLSNRGVAVTAVCRQQHAGLMTSLGASRVIDYRSEDFTSDDERYDYVFDVVGTTGFRKCRAIMKEKAVFAGNASTDPLWGVLTLRSRGKRVLFMPPPDIRAVLHFVRDLVEEGRFTPVIDRTYPLDDIAEAFTYVATGQKVGNVVLTMDA
jgi:NADPH:quinone reductase-like Zn-dependent oxidoreductase